MKCFNNKKREELGWQSPFEVYFGRQSNELVRCGLPENQGSPKVRKVSKPMKNDFNRFKTTLLEKKNLIPTKGWEKEQLNISKKRNKCSVYKINQKVLVRYGKKGKKAPKRRYSCIGKTEKVGKYHMYKVGYRDLVHNQKFPVGSL